MSREAMRTYADTSQGLLMRWEFPRGGHDRIVTAGKVVVLESVLRVELWW